MKNPKHPVDVVIIDAFRRDDADHSFNITELHQEVAKAGLSVSRPTVAARVKSLQKEGALSFGGYSKIGRTQAADFWLVDEHPYFNGDGVEAVEAATSYDRTKRASSSDSRRVSETLASKSQQTIEFVHKLTAMKSSLGELEALVASFETQIADRDRIIAAIRSTLEAE